MTQGFYFSYDYPLHLSIQDNSIFEKKVYNQIDNIFVWNKSAFSQLMKIEENQDFFIPII